MKLFNEIVKIVISLDRNTARLDDKIKKRSNISNVWGGEIETGQDLAEYFTDHLSCITVGNIAEYMTDTFNGDRFSDNLSDLQEKIINEEWYRRAIASFQAIAYNQDYWNEDKNIQCGSRKRASLACYYFAIEMIDTKFSPDEIVEIVDEFYKRVLTK